MSSKNLVFLGPRRRPVTGHRRSGRGGPGLWGRDGSCHSRRTGRGLCGVRLVDPPSRTRGLGYGKSSVERCGRRHGGPDHSSFRRRGYRRRGCECQDGGTWESHRSYPTRSDPAGSICRTDPLFDLSSTSSEDRKCINSSRCTVLVDTRSPQDPCSRTVPTCPPGVGRTETRETPSPVAAHERGPELLEQYEVPVERRLPDCSRVAARQPQLLCQRTLSLCPSCVHLLP